MRNVFLRKGKTILKIVSSLVVFSMMIETPGVVVNTESESVVSGTKPVAGLAMECKSICDDENIKLDDKDNTDKEKKSTDSNKKKEKLNKDKDSNKDEYKNIGIVTAKGSKVNVRKAPEVDSAVVAKMKEGSAGYILKKSKEWYKICSGGVVGYVKKELMTSGKKVKKLAKKYAIKVAKVTTQTLNVREKADKESKIVEQIGEDDVVRVKKDVDKEWIKILTNNKNTGYVLKEYVEISHEFRQAEPVVIEEELEVQDSNNDSNDNNSYNYVSNRSYKSSSNGNSGYRRSSRRRYSSSSSSYSDSYVGNGSGNGSDVVSYAKQFLGNKYVYGGQSLTNGTDCSGFTRQIYKKFGYSLPRTSSAQRSSGKSISKSQLKPGDLVCYSGHVAIYAGNNKIVHASDPKGGIKVSNINCQTPVAYKRIVK